jgi:sulfite reductase alpha subunit-like flavoprotein
MLLVLYGSQTGTAQDVAERVARDAQRRRWPVRLMPMDRLGRNGGFLDGMRALDDASVAAVVFICATTGQGQEPDNMKALFLLGARALIADVLARFAS